MKRINILLLIFFSTITYASKKDEPKVLAATGIVLPPYQKEWNEIPITKYTRLPGQEFFAENAKDPNHYRMVNAHRIISKFSNTSNKCKEEIRNYKKMKFQVENIKLSKSLQKMGWKCAFKAKRAGQINFLAIHINSKRKKGKFQPVGIVHEHFMNTNKNLPGGNFIKWISSITMI